MNYLSKDILKNPLLLFFLINKYFNILIGNKTKPIELKNITIPTLDRSFVRRGDGESNAALGISFSFENGSLLLSEYLKKIITYNGTAILIGLPLEYIIKKENKVIGIALWRTTRLFLSKYIDIKKEYGDAFYFRNMKDIEEFNAFYSTKKIILISNKETLDKTQGKINNLIGQFEIPYRNSFDQYYLLRDQIYNYLNMNIINTSDTLVLISGGPFAKALSYDLTIEKHIICHDVGAVFDLYL